jgi:hypothetical protein
VAIFQAGRAVPRNTHTRFLADSDLCSREIPEDWQADTLWVFGDC